MEGRFKVKSPSLEVHERVRGLAEESNTLVLENIRRLSLSVRDPSNQLVQSLQKEGAQVSEEGRYDLEIPGG
jgi:hypothetical protein